MGYVTAPNPGRIWLPASDLANPTGTATNTIAANREVWRLDPAGTENLSATLLVPQDWATGTLIEVHIHWMRQAGSTGNVVWRADYLSTAEGESVGVGSITAGTNTAALAGNASTSRHIIHGYSDSTNLSVPGAALSRGDSLLIVINRIGGDGGDTMSDDARVWGIELRYTTVSSSA